jgi:ribonuclease R
MMVKIKKQWFGRTVIHSDRRFTYEEAQERLKQNKEICRRNQCSGQLAKIMQNVSERSHYF